MNEVKTEEVEEVKAQEQPEVKSLPVQEVFNQYPVDREKARDAVLMEISNSLIKISASMETLPQALLGISQKLENLNKNRIAPG